MVIRFFIEDIDFTPPTPTKIKNWLSKVIQSERHKLKELNYIFCSDAYLQRINKEYLAHDSFTDIITFNNSDTPLHIVADVFISIHRIHDNAGVYQTSFHDELRRVMVHGVLHLMGYNDKTSDEQQEMRKKEEAYLSL